MLLMSQKQKKRGTIDRIVLLVWSVKCVSRWCAWAVCVWMDWCIHDWAMGAHEWKRGKRRVARWMVGKKGLFTRSMWMSLFFIMSIEKERQKRRGRDNNSKNCMPCVYLSTCYTNFCAVLCVCKGVYICMIWAPEIKCVNHIGGKRCRTKTEKW